MVTLFKGLSPGILLVYGVRLFYTNWDMFVGVLKSFVFGIIISLFGCYYGYTSSGGPKAWGGDHGLGGRLQCLRARFGIPDFQLPVR